MGKKSEVFYYLDGVDINSIINAHIEYLQEKGKTTKINQQILYTKYEFLIHIICKRTSSSKNGKTTLNAEILKGVLDMVYIDMLHVLDREKIIDTNWGYDILVKSREYELYDNYKPLIKQALTSNLKILKYIFKMEQLLGDKNEVRVKKDKAKITHDGDKLYDSYSKNLKKLRISNVNELDEYINQKVYMSINQQNYYKSIYNHYLHDYNKFKITSIDDNFRIYSILTSTPRYFKNFINIKYSIDIKNSHPLLFNYYIIKYYKINFNIISKFYNHILHDNNISHYNAVENISKSLNISYKEKLQISSIPKDIWLYIAKTTRGEFWDDFKDKFIEYGLDRIDVKITLFQEVFYSHSVKSHGKLFAKQFKEIYPSVYALLSKYKEYKKQHRFDNADKAKDKITKAIETQKAINASYHFANNMMGLESTLFQKILNTLYKKRGCCALSIHDAIIILDTKGNQKYSEEDIMKAMRKIYQEYNLYPTFSVEKYNSFAWRKELEQEKQNKPLVEDQLTQLKERAGNGDKTALEMLNLIDSGQVEIAFDYDGQMYYHRLFDHKVRNATITKNYKTLQKGNKRLKKEASGKS